MKREDIFDESRIKPRCLPKAKLFVAQLLEIASDIAPIMSKAKEGLDEQDERPSDYALYRAETSMLYLTQKMQMTMKSLEECYEKQPKGVKTIFNRECMIELFLSMIQECLNNGGAYGK